MAKIAYCSWCFTKTRHKLIEEHTLKSNIYQCSQCEGLTQECKALQCKHMAQGSKPTEQAAPYWQKVKDSLPDLFCAEHNGSIPNFKTLKEKLKDIDDYERIYSQKSSNWSSYVKVGAAAIGGLAISVPLSYKMAPSLASLVKPVGKTASGVALEGFAQLLRAKGAPLAMLTSPGTFTLVAIGSSLGSANSAIVAYSYLKDLDKFSLRKIKDGKEPGIVVINGFLTEDDHDPKDWQKGLKTNYRKHALYHLVWDSGQVSDLKEGLLKPTVNALLSSLGKASFGLSTALLPARLASNPWVMATHRSQKVAQILADLIARTQKKYILMGHSLGARIVMETLELLATKDKKWITDAYLLGAAFPRKEKELTKLATGALSGHLINAYSKHDGILKTLYQGAHLYREEPSGLKPLLCKDKKIININCSDFVKSHFDFKNHLEKIIKESQKSRSFIAKLGI